MNDKEDINKLVEILMEQMKKPVSEFVKFARKIDSFCEDVDDKVAVEFFNHLKINLLYNMIANYNNINGEPNYEQVCKVLEDVKEFAKLLENDLIKNPDRVQIMKGDIRD